jgi:hypothetical protein
MLSKTREKVLIKGLAIFTVFLIVGFFLIVSSMSKALFPLMLISFAITGLTIGYDLMKNRERFRLLIACFFGILSYATFYFITVLPETLKSLEVVLLPFVGGFLVTALSKLLGLLANHISEPVSVVAGWISESQILGFSIGALLTLYIAFIRSPLLKAIPIVVIGEWFAIVFAIFLTYMEFRRATSAIRPESKFSEWQKHVQKIKQETHEDFNYLTYIQDLFINSGKKELMLVYYALQLREQGESENRILRKIEELLEYEDKKIPSLAFPWTKKKIQKMNRKTKEELLKRLVEEIT